MPIKVRETGRFKAPVLDNSVYQAIGREMLRSQKARILRGRNVRGGLAKPLAKGYAKFKKRFLKKRSIPRRDMTLTGQTMENFQLRKATAGVIRADITAREPRRRAKRSQRIEPMIGFSPGDKANLTKFVKAKYGIVTKNLWVGIKI